jgi:hypothetical protein
MRAPHTILLAGCRNVAPRGVTIPDPANYADSPSLRALQLEFATPRIDNGHREQVGQILNVLRADEFHEPPALASDVPLPKYFKQQGYETVGGGRLLHSAFEGRVVPRHR